MSALAHEALARLRHRHVAVATVVTCMVTAGSVAFQPSHEVQAALLLVAAAVFGVPHGALDHLAGRATFQDRLGALWLPVFLTLYLAVCTCVVLVWLWVPLPMLLCFLLVAVVHFGSEDVGPLSQADHHEGGLRPWIRRGEVLGRGALPIVVPSAAHPTEVGRIFDALGLASTTIDGETVALTIGTAWPLAALALAPVIGHMTSRAVRSRSTSPVSSLIELPIIVSALVLLPPLLGFVVYFVGWHAVRHTLVWVVRLNPTNPRHGFMSFTRLALPLTLGTIALGSGAWIWMDTPPGERALQVVFVGLAALTFPHVALELVTSGSDER